MKNIFYLIVVFAVCISCNTTPSNKETKEIAEVSQKEYASYGKEITKDGAISYTDMEKKFNSLAVGDTVAVKFTSKINSVCSKKGCWMRLDLGQEKEAMVKFKDYGFFMPLDADGEVIVNGKAFVQETSVDELKHYAEDAGKSKEEIAAITAPKRTLSFLADGVLLKN